MDELSFSANKLPKPDKLTQKTHSEHMFLGTLGFNDPGMFSSKLFPKCLLKEDLSPKNCKNT